MDRNQFLKLSAGVAAGALVMPFAANARSTESKITIKKSLKFGMVEEKLSVLDKFKLLKDVGFHGVHVTCYFG